MLVPISIISPTFSVTGLAVVPIVITLPATLNCGLLKLLVGIKYSPLTVTLTGPFGASVTV